MHAKMMDYVSLFPQRSRSRPIIDLIIYIYMFKTIFEKKLVNLIYFEKQKSIKNLTLKLFVVVISFFFLLNFIFNSKFQNSETYLCLSIC